MDVFAKIRDVLGKIFGKKAGPATETAQSDILDLVSQYETVPGGLRNKNTGTIFEGVHDPLQAAVMEKAFFTGQAVIGNRGPEGVTLKSYPLHQNH